MPARLVSVPLVLLLVVQTGSHRASASSVEVTCARATSPGGHKDLAPFCVSSLQAAPGSGGADARALAAIATNLTLANYTAAVATIKSLQQRLGGSGGGGTLVRCRTRYIEALNVVHSAVHALATGSAPDYVADMRVVRSAATDCKDALGASGDDGPDESPMRKVNEDAVNLTTVAMLIVQSLE
uniref:Pectinesterase inhibitor domain-containing protein n=1 Tax=Arundo donax TaxID=35708 RepID=A0A0A9DLG3_ARUDO